MRANQNPAEIQEWGEDLALEITTIAALAWFLKSAVDILEKHIPESKLPPILSQSSLQMLHKGLKDAKLQIIEDQRILGDGLASKADKEEALENLEVTPQIMYSALFDKKGVEARLEAFIVVLDELRGPATLSKLSDEEKNLIEALEKWTAVAFFELGYWDSLYNLRTNVPTWEKKAGPMFTFADEAAKRFTDYGFADQYSDQFEKKRVEFDDFYMTLKKNFWNDYHVAEQDLTEDIKKIGLDLRKAYDEVFLIDEKMRQDREKKAPAQAAENEKPISLIEKTQQDQEKEAQTKEPKKPTRLNRLGSQVARFANRVETELSRFHNDLFGLDELNSETQNPVSQPGPSVSTEEKNSSSSQQADFEDELNSKTQTFDSEEDLSVSADSEHDLSVVSEYNPSVSAEEKDNSSSQEADFEDELNSETQTFDSEDDLSVSADSEHDPSVFAEEKDNFSSQQADFEDESILSSYSSRVKSHDEDMENLNLKLDTAEKELTDMVTAMNDELQLLLARQALTRLMKILFGVQGQPDSQERIDCFWSDQSKWSSLVRSSDFFKRYAPLIYPTGIKEMRAHLLTKLTQFGLQEDGSVPPIEEVVAGLNQKKCLSVFQGLGQIAQNRLNNSSSRTESVKNFYKLVAKFADVAQLANVAELANFGPASKAVYNNSKSLDSFWGKIKAHKISKKREEAGSEVKHRKRPKRGPL